MAIEVNVPATESPVKERAVEVKTTQAGVKERAVEVKIEDFSYEPKLKLQTPKDEPLNISRDDKLYELLEPEPASPKKSLTKPDPLRFRQTLKSPKKSTNNMSENWFITQGAMVKLGFDGNAQSKYQKIGDKVKPNTTIETIGGNFGTAAGIIKYFEIAGNTTSEILLSLGCMLIDSYELQFYVPYGGVVEDESTL